MVDEQQRLAKFSYDSLTTIAPKPVVFKDKVKAFSVCGSHLFLVSLTNAMTVCQESPENYKQSLIGSQENEAISAVSTIRLGKGAVRAHSRHPILLLFNCYSSIKTPRANTIKAKVLKYTTNGELKQYQIENQIELVPGQTEEVTMIRQTLINASLLLVIAACHMGSLSIHLLALGSRKRGSTTLLRLGKQQCHVRTGMRSWDSIYSVAVCPEGEKSLRKDWLIMVSGEGKVQKLRVNL